MIRWAALLKGVNLNGRKLPMADLAALVAGLGHKGVKTLLASGNVVFDAVETDPAVIAAQLEATLAAYGLKTDVVVRSADALRAVLAANPFAGAARDRPNHLLVLFHRDPMPTDPIERLATLYDGPERLAAVGRELFVDFPEGIGTSKLVPAMAKAKFPKIATGRNWNTVTKLGALLDG